MKFIGLVIGLYASFASALVLEELVEKNQLEATFEHKKIGYYIGSFDPLHLGHEQVVEEILNKELCDYVLIYPAWGGDIYKNRTDVTIRLEIIYSSFQHHPKVIVTKMNPQDLQKTLTVDTPQRTINDKPTVKNFTPEAEFIGIIGSDAALDTVKDKKRLSVFMEGIKIPEKYKENTLGGIIALPVHSFIVSQRQGDNLDSLEGKIGSRPILHIVQTKYPGMSSSKIKALLKEGKSISGFISSGVLDIIQKYHLYK